MGSGKFSVVLKPSLSWCLVFIPISVYLEHFHTQAHLWILFSACLAIIPLAGLLGEATKHIAEKMGEGIGGLLNPLFVAPLLVFLSYVIGPQPMDLVFTRGEVLAVILSTFMVGFAAGDGRSNWFMGTQLLAVYLVLAVAFYFTPG